MNYYVAILHLDKYIKIGELPYLIILGDDIIFDIILF